MSKFKFFVIVLLLGAAYMAWMIFENPKREVIAKGLWLGSSVVNIEIASSRVELGRGLSGRDYLAPKNGMLFVYKKQEVPGFWMRDMKFPLDLIWISEQEKVVGVTPDVKPDSYPQSYGPPEPIKYVLEVNAGFAKANNISEGTAVHFNDTTKAIIEDIVKSEK